MIAELKTVTRLIDATGFDQRGQAIAIRYVREDGQVKDMLVSKAKKPGHKSANRKASTQNVGLNTRKAQAMLLISDHTEHGRYKSLFMFAIVAFNPDGNLAGPWHTIKRGT